MSANDDDARRPAQMWTKTCGARRKECQEANGDRGSSKAGSTAPSVVGKQRGIRTIAK
jgi:hypothetical protein